MIAKEDRHGGRNEKEDKKIAEIEMMKMKTEKALNF